VREKQPCERAFLRQAGYESISDLPRIEQSVFFESIGGNTTGDEDMCNVKRRAKSSGIHSGSERTVTETATDHAIVL